MCGRFSLFASWSEVEKAFGVRLGKEFKPSYNIAPGAEAAVVFNDEPSILQSARWGLVPSWSKTEKTNYSMINARVESIEEKPAFRPLMKSKRCIVPADGFYEWKKEEDGGKTPFRIEYARGLFAFAGLWDEWRKEDGSPLRSFTIITTSPNSAMKEIHDRMPVMLAPSQMNDWLLAGKKELLSAMPSESISLFPISTLVNNPRNDTPAVLARLDSR